MCRRDYSFFTMNDTYSLYFHCISNPVHKSQLQRKRCDAGPPAPTRTRHERLGMHNPVGEEDVSLYD